MAEWLIVVVIRPMYAEHFLLFQSHPPVAECHPPHFSYPDSVLCSEQQVCDLLAALDITKASGQDGILARMLRYPVPSIASILTHSTIQSVVKLRCHSIWLEKSLIVPIPKNSDGSKPTNYRPISLLSIISKVMIPAVHMSSWLLI